MQQVIQSAITVSCGILELGAECEVFAGVANPYPDFNRDFAPDDLVQHVCDIGLIFGRVVRLTSGPLVPARICENNVDDYCDWFLLVSPFSKVSLGAEDIRVADSRQVDLGDDEGTGRRRVTRLCGRR